MAAVAHLSKSQFHRLKSVGTPTNLKPILFHNRTGVIKYKPPKKVG